MPPPVSYIDINAIPFSQLVTQAMFNVANEQWFRFVTATQIAFGTFTDEGGTFVPRTRFYESDGSTLIKSWDNGIGGYHLLAAGTYYIQITRVGGGASNFDFTFTANTQAVNSASLVEGDLIINDDIEDFPAFVTNPDGSIKTILTNIPAGEMGCILPTGESIWHDRYGFINATNRIAIFDANGTYVASVGANNGSTSFNFPRFTHDGTKFYLVNRFDEIWTVTTAGIATDTGFFLPGTPSAIALDGTTLYWAERDVDTIHTFDVVTGLAGADFYTIPGFDSGDSDTVATTANLHPGDMFILGTNLVTFWTEGDTLNSHIIVVRLSDGVLQNSIDYTAPANQVNHLFYYEGDNAHVGVWLYNDNGYTTYTIGRVNLTTEVLDENFSGPQFSAGINMASGADGEEIFGLSTSCTILRMQAGSASPTGTITVIKATVPEGLTQSFEFAAGGGLSPTSFTLEGDGDEQTFLGVPVGSGYSIEEVAQAGYVTTYEVSNDSPIDNISVDEDEVVIITVTNRAVVSGGIYKIVPGKRNDTLWNEDQTTQDVKIPNVYGTSGLIGD